MNQEIASILVAVVIIETFGLFILGFLVIMLEKELKDAYNRLLTMASQRHNHSNEAETSKETSKP